MEAHPLELELLALVEGDLGRSETRALEQHLAACPACSAAVAQQRAARELLRAAPPVELRQVDVRRLVHALPAHPPRPLPWWRRRVALVAVPSLGVAAAAAAVALSLSGGGGGSSVPRGEAAQPSALAAKVAGTTGVTDAGPLPAPLAGAAAKSSRVEAAPLTAVQLLRAVAGSAAAVSGRLAAAGIVAAVEDGSVVVRRADAAQARKALASLPAGPVRVLLR